LHEASFAPASFALPSERSQYSVDAQSLESRHVAPGTTHFWKEHTVAPEQHVSPHASEAAQHCPPAQTPSPLSPHDRPAVLHSPPGTLPDELLVEVPGRKPALLLLPLDPTSPPSALGSRNPLESLLPQPAATAAAVATEDTINATIRLRALMDQR